MGNLNVSKNKYSSKKQLVKQTQTTPGTEWSMTYKYKAIKASASDVNKVAAQHSPICSMTSYRCPSLMSLVYEETQAAANAPTVAANTAFAARSPSLLIPAQRRG